MPETDLGSPPVNTFSGLTTVVVLSPSLPLPFSSLSLQAVNPKQKAIPSIKAAITLNIFINRESCFTPIP